jgi:hypothetical protein
MLLGFKKQFAQPILDGSKIFTVREKRKVEPKIGERLYMYTGLRTKDCEKITDEHELTGIQLVSIRVSDISELKVSVWVDGVALGKSAISLFVNCDGFDSKEEFAAFWLAGVKKNEYGHRVVYKADLVMHHWTGFRF